MIGATGMTLFEYLAIAFSLVFSFSAMRLVSGLPHALDPGRRYGLHVCFLLVQLVGTAGQFWVFWSYRGVAWSFSQFLLVLVNPSILYFNACTLVPEAPGSVESWRTHYYAVRRKYFLAIALYSLVLAADASFVLQLPVVHVARVFQAVLFVVGIVGTASESPRVHAGIALFLAVSMASALFVVFGSPSSLGP